MKYIRQGKNQPSPWNSLKNQIYLGTDQFIEDVQCKIDPDQPLKDIPRKQKQAPPELLKYYKDKYEDARAAMAKAYLSGHYTQSEVGDYFGVSYATVSRAVKSCEQRS